MFSFLRSTSPSTGSSQLNAVESYIIVCIFSIFGAIIEYAIILSINTLRPDPQDTVQTVLQPSEYQVPLDGTDSVSWEDDLKVNPPNDKLGVHFH